MSNNTTDKSDAAIPICEALEVVVQGFCHKSGYSVGVFAFRVIGEETLYTINALCSEQPNSTVGRAYAGACAGALADAQPGQKIRLRLNLEWVVNHLTLGLASGSAEPPPLKDGNDVKAREHFARFFQSVREKGLQVEVEHFKVLNADDELVMRQMRAARNRIFADLDKTG